MPLLEETLKKISHADADVANLAQNKLDSLTKPQGSLGLLEECAKKYASARGDIDAQITGGTVLTSYSDHGGATRLRNNLLLTSLRPLSPRECLRLASPHINTHIRYYCPLCWH